MQGGWGVRFRIGTYPNGLTFCLGGYFDLEDPASLRRLEEPMLALQDLKGVVVMDGIQRVS